MSEDIFQIQRFDPRAISENLSKSKDKNKDTPVVSLKSNTKFNDDADEASISDSSSASNDTESSSSVPSSSTDDNRSLSEVDDIANDDEPFVIAPDQTAGINQSRKRSRSNVTTYDEEAVNDLMEVSSTSHRIDSKLMRAAMKYAEMPIEEAAKIWKLPDFLVRNLLEDKYEHFFPIQCLVIPDVIASERHSHLLQCRDICVNAPTGSGKTLSFVLPVLNALSNRHVTRLRALAILPSRDLAEQVYQVFKRYARGSTLKVGLAIGGGHSGLSSIESFLSEQRMLLINKDSENSAGYFFDSQSLSIEHSINPLDIDVSLALQSRMILNHKESDGDNLSPSALRGGISAIDILVATPGRLLEHLEHTKGFTLQHLRFLIIDEADRLLNQNYSDWINKINVSTNLSSSKSKHSSDQSLHFQKSPDGMSFILDAITRRESTSRSILTDGHETSRAISLRKMLFSATLSNDPQKLASLGLTHPKYFDVSEFHKAHYSEKNIDIGESDTQKYIIPPTLTELVVECTAEQKPLVLVALLREFRQHLHDGSEKVSVVFTGSVDSTHRLARLLQLIWGSAEYGPASCIAEYSSQLKQKHRQRIIESCKNGDIKILICSDGMSRGMDLDVNVVIHYDLPSYANTYVHRCGRTARAGKKGFAISILKTGQRAKFDKMRQLLVANKVIEKGIKKDMIDRAIAVYTKCTKQVRRILDDEANGILRFHVPIRDEYLV